MSKRVKTPLQHRKEHLLGKFEEAEGFCTFHWSYKNKTNAPKSYEKLEEAVNLIPIPGRGCI